MLLGVAVILFAYLIGSIPTGYWLVKATKGIDIRQVGSGSTGATNVLRAAGKFSAAFVLIFDVLKGYVPVYLAIVLDQQYSSNSWYLLPPLAAISVVIGHSKSIFLGFQGGKSAATSLGTLLAMNAWVGWSTFGVWVMFVFITRFVSVASIIAGVFSVIFMYLFHNPLSYIAYCFLAASYVIYRHKPNMSRLIAGTEPKIGQAKRGETV